MTHYVSFAVDDDKKKKNKKKTRFDCITEISNNRQFWHLCKPLLRTFTDRADMLAPFPDWFILCSIAVLI